MTAILWTIAVIGAAASAIVLRHIFGSDGAPEYVRCECKTFTEARTSEQRAADAGNMVDLADAWDRAAPVTTAPAGSA